MVVAERPALDHRAIAAWTMAETSESFSLTTCCASRFSPFAAYKAPSPRSTAVWTLFVTLSVEKLLVDSAVIGPVVGEVQAAPPTKPPPVGTVLDARPTGAPLPL